MSWILFFIWLIGLIFLLAKLPIVKNCQLKFRFILLLFFVKILAGVGLTLLYTNYYSDRGSADIYKFYDDAQVIASALPENPAHYLKLMSGFYDNDAELKIYTDSIKNWNPQSSEWLEFTQTQNYNIFQSNRIVTRINAILIPLTAGNIFTIVLLFSWISLLGLVVFISLFNHNESAISYSILLLFPSTLLWCSAPMKDTLTLLGVCLVFYHATKLKLNTNSIKSTLWIIFSLLIILLTKYYVAIAFIPALAIMTIQRKWNSIKQFKGTFLILIGVALLVFSSTILPHLVDVLNGKREEALKAAIFGEAKHFLFVDLIDGGLPGFLLEIPQAIYAGLFRPMIWEANDSLLVKISSLENMGLLTIILFSLVNKRNRHFKSIHFFPMLAYTLTLALIIGYTTPVAGGLVRYKTAFLLPLLFLCMNQIEISQKLRQRKIYRMINDFVLKPIVDPSQANESLELKN